MVGSLNSRQKNSAADDVDGCGVMCPAADVEATGVLNTVDGEHAFDVAADDGVNAADDACGVEVFLDITAGADDIDIVGDGGLGSCCEAKYSSSV